MIYGTVADLYLLWWIIVKWNLYLGLVMMMMIEMMRMM